MVFKKYFHTNISLWKEVVRGKKYKNELFKKAYFLVYKHLIKFQDLAEKFLSL